MKKYVSKPPRPRADDDYWWRSSDAAWYAAEGAATSLIVHEEEQSTFSGLYDAEGNELHREREPIGFKLR